MADIFREVDEDLRRDQIKRLWDRFGIYAIIVAVLVVAVTAGWRGYVAWQQSKAAESGDLFFAAIKLSADGDHAGAAAALSELAADAGGGYALIGRFRAASETARAGDRDGAVAAFDKLAEDASVEPVYRDLARIRAGYLLLDGGDRAAVDARVVALADGKGPWRQSARELAGLAAYAAGDVAAARARFEQIVGDLGGSEEFANRARIMLALIKGDAPAAPPAAEESKP